jgi:seryl-tRNA synthetase
LIGTAEIPLAGMYANELLRKELLPAKFVAFSHCFRKEAGRGEHSKGLYRLHQFSKVEMFALTRSDGVDSNVYSEEVLAEMVEIQKEIMEELEFPYRVLNMATEELGAAAFRKFDIEAWIPSKKSYGEVCSASNCTSY